MRPHFRLSAAARLLGVQTAYHGYSDEFVATDLAVLAQLVKQGEVRFGDVDKHLHERLSVLEFTTSLISYSCP